VLENLMESAPERRGLTHWGSSAVSLTAHMGMLAIAVLSTMKPDVPVARILIGDVPPYYHDKPEVDRPSVDPVRTMLPSIPRGLVPPIETPTGIPPIDLHRAYGTPHPEESTFGKTVFERERGAPADTGAVLTFESLDEVPERISSPPLEYPRMMQQAGIEGLVVLQAVVDSAGRVEDGSIAVVRSDHPAFVRPAVRLLERSLFRPGRVGGRPVRVLIQLPVHFELSRQRDGDPPPIAPSTFARLREGATAPRTCTGSAPHPNPVRGR